MLSALKKCLHWLDWGRRLAVNLFFLGLIGAAVTIAVLSRSPGIGKQTVLVLQLKGPLVESPRRAPGMRLAERLVAPERGEQVSLPELVHVLNRAAKDPHITKALILLDGFEGGGLASLDELAKALAQFRAAGKPVIAWATRYDQRQLRIAAQATEVILHPMGEVLITGLGGRRNYYRDALDRLGITANLIRVGEFKSAAEPFVAREPSPEALQASSVVLDALWLHYRAAVEQARKLAPGSIAQALDDLPGSLIRAGGDAAGLAKSLGLVDSLMPYSDLRERLIREGIRDDDHKSFRQVSLAGYLRAYPLEEDDDAEDAIGILVAEGEISEGEASAGGIGGRSLAARIRQAREDKNIKAIVLRIDSPGGSAVGSELIRHELQRTREAGKPIVASMGDLAASGGYWIALAADRIIAHPATITGSIGVFALLPTGQALLDKLSVRTGGYRTGWLAGGFDPRVDLDPRIRDLAQSRVNRIYDDFIGLSATARGLDPAAVNKVAGGRIWSGEQALERRLVDQVGGLDEAIDTARQLLAKAGTEPAAPKGAAPTAKGADPDKAAKDGKAGESDTAAKDGKAKDADKAAREAAALGVRYLTPRTPWFEDLWQRWIGRTADAILDATLATPRTSVPDGESRVMPPSGPGPGATRSLAGLTGSWLPLPLADLQREALWLTSTMLRPEGSGVLAHCLCAAEP